MSEQSSSPEKLTRRQHARLNSARYQLLTQVEDWLETPMLVLGFVWLALLVAEFMGYMTRTLEVLATGIWIIFGLDFLLRFWLAPAKVEYLKRNWLTVLSLLVPALRIFRIARVMRILKFARVTRGLRLFRLLTSLNRGMRALAQTLGRRGFGYVVVLTVIVTLSGAAGMYSLEDGQSFDTYPEALWWTAMMMTTLGSDAWPQTGEGRLLCFGLALYAFTVFGYVTATLATFFLGRDAENKDAELAGAEELRALRRELRELRTEIRVLTSSRHDLTL